MSKYRAMQKVRAFEAGAAQPYRERRHFYVADRPLVLAYVQMAGETFSLWACLCGRDRDDPYWIVADEPRDRNLQSAAFTELADVINAVVDDALESDLEAPQLWVSNKGAAENLGRLGRVMRARYVSDAVSLAGAYLDLFAQSVAAPTSVLCLAATDALSRLKVTGQSDLEDANLASQLMWWDRRLLAKLRPDVTVGQAKAMSVFEAAAEAEQLPMGTLTTPTADEEIDEKVRQLGALRREGKHNPKLVKELHDHLYSQVFPIWEAIWEAHRLVVKCPQSPAADARWQEDSKGFRWQHEFLISGGTRRFVDSPMRAAKLLGAWEAQQADAVREEVAHDRLALVEAVLDSTAVVGKVVAVKRLKVGRTTHPYITLDVESTELTKGTEVWWRGNLKVKGEITEMLSMPKGGIRLTIEVVEGMRNNTMPAAGSTTAFITLPPSFGARPLMHGDPPWTHRSRVEVVDDDD